MISRVTQHIKPDEAYKAYILYGDQVTDRFIHEDLTITTIENVLLRYLTNNSFDTVAFYHTHEKLITINNTLSVTGNPAEPGGSGSPQPQRRSKRINLREKVGAEGKPPLDRAIIVSSNEAAVQQQTESSSQRLEWTFALEHFNAAMMRSEKRSAIIFRDAHNMYQNGQFDANFFSRFNLWMTNSSNRSCIFFIFVANNLDDNVIFPAEIKNKISTENGQAVKVSGAPKEELRRLILKRSICDGMRIDYTILENAVQVLGGISEAKEFTMNEWLAPALLGGCTQFDKKCIQEWKIKRRGTKKNLDNLGDKTIDKLDKVLNELDIAEMYEELKVVRDQQDNVEGIVSTLDGWYLGKRAKPLVFLLSGTSGTGKTFTVEKLAESMNPYGYQFFYKSMTEFNSEADINKLIGSPTGYVGSDQRPELFEALRNAEGKLIICFDEIDKAHEKIAQSLMQLFEKGVLSWNNERGDFSKCIIFLTSNAAMDELVSLKQLSLSSKRSVESKEFNDECNRILTENKFPSYILGRMNKRLIYNPLSDTAVVEIAVQETKKFFIDKKDGLTVSRIDQAYLMDIVRAASGSTLGARVIKERVESILNDNGKATSFLRANRNASQIYIKSGEHGIEIIPDTEPEPQNFGKLTKAAAKLYEVEKNRLGCINKEKMEKILSVVRCQQDNIAQIIQSVESWFQNPIKPLTLFLAGTSGTGKSFTAEKLAEAMKEYGYECKFFPMNEYADESKAGDIFGVPRGFRGDRDKPKLYADIERANGKLVICFDEVEKAYDGFYNKIMSLMQNGSMEWAYGKGDFRKCIIVMTSNIAMNAFMKLKERYANKKPEADDLEKFKEESGRIMNDNKIPTFITGRIDLTLIYNFLDAESVYDIGVQEITKFAAGKRRNVHFIAPSLLADVIKNSVKSNEGARRVQKVIKSLLEAKLTNFVAANPETFDIVILTAPAISISAFKPEDTLPSDEENKKQALDLFEKEQKKISVFAADEATEIFSRILGQEDIIPELLRTLRAWYMRKQKDKPLSLLFAGVSGTGKTFTAQRIAEVFAKMSYGYHEEDMTQYKSEHDITRFIGSAEGYVGSDKPPLIVEKLKTANGKLVICFDEIDKAHPGIIQSFMQIMDQGRLKTNKEEFDMKQCILVFTSNGAMNELAALKASFTGDTSDESFRKQVEDILGKSGFPSFILGRLNNIFIFNPFTKNIVLNLAAAEIGAFLRTYDSNLRVNYIAPSILAEITEDAAGSNQGARKVKKCVESAISEAVLKFMESSPECTDVSITREGGTVCVAGAPDSVSHIEKCKKEAEALMDGNK